jgi:riboflavin biosynthesis pyrimidine reductase
VRNERYGNVLPGRPEQPLVVIVSASGALPPDLPLLAEPQTRIVLATASAAELEFEHAARLDYLHLPAPGGGVDLPALLRTLRDQFGVRSVVCEGGPTLNDGLIAAGLIDELYLTLSPKLVDGGERALIDSSQPYAQIDARLMDVDSVDDFVFLRYEL